NRHDQAGFDRYLHQVYDPHSKNFHHFLTQREIADRFGPSQTSYDAVLAYLKDRGFTLVEGSANRMTITVRGTRAMAEHAFATQIGDYRIGQQVFYANESDPALPRQIAVSVIAVQGLSNLARPKPAIKAVLEPIANAICPDNAISYGENVYFEDLLACPVSPPSAYDTCKAAAACAGSIAGEQAYFNCFSSFWVEPEYNDLNLLLINLAAACSNTSNSPEISPGMSSRHENNFSKPASAINGAGQKIGLVEFDSFNPSDVSDYLALLGLPSTLMNNLSKVDVNGGTTPGPNQDEVLLDIDTLLVTAPGAQVMVYDAPFVGAGLPASAEQDDQRRRKHHLEQLVLLRGSNNRSRRAGHRFIKSTGGRLRNHCAQCLR
ncbi:MAG TPA: protease pro-enzyme activation domain-containing protein, partial [Candidatus Binataceae bacterium]|nr:protease pro-enzyme activation domain-containing protein [Candidatus Binataceae bacterium]